MIRSSLAGCLSVLLSFSVEIPAFGKGVPPPSPPKPTVQEKAVLIQTGSIVEVKTKDKRKVKGRLLAVTSESFDVQSATGQSIDKQTFRFEDVKDLKQIQKEGGMSTTAKVTLGVLAGIGVVFLVFTLVAVATGWD